MKIIIDISEEYYKDIQARDWKNTIWADAVTKAIHEGIVLPEHHGRLIDKDHVIARLEAASKFFGGENADAFDERFSHGLREAAIKVAEEPTIIEADSAGSEEV